MIGLTVKVVDRELLINLESIPRKLRGLIDEKLKVVSEQLRAKVVENLSGKVLNTKSGALSSAVKSEIAEIGSLRVASVDIESDDSKVQAYAMAHEYGGKGYYEIVPVNKLILQFVGKSGEIVRTPYVYHPPAKEQSYLRSALWEMAPEIEAELNEAVREALRG